MIETRTKSEDQTTHTGLHVRISQNEPVFLDVALDCPGGKLLALTGPSGSGKSTVLRAIAGLFKVAEGIIECDGETWMDSRNTPVTRAARRRRVGYVFQDYGLFPHMNVLDNVMTSMGHLPKSMRKTTAAVILENVNMAGLGTRLPSQLSGGQKQRVALARALARDPAVLLLDEPFSAVDQQTRQKLYLELARLRAGLGIPVVLVTHDISEVLQLADHVALIKRGKTIQTGTVTEVLDKPESVAAARLVGQQNLFDAKVTAVNKDSVGISILGTEIAANVPESSFLDTDLNRPIQDGESLTALIPQSAVILHRAERRSMGEGENPLFGVVEETIPLGDDILVRIKVESNQPLLAFKVSRHVASRNNLSPNLGVTVSVLSRDIHLIREPFTGSEQG